MAVSPVPDFVLRRQLFPAGFLGLFLLAKEAQTFALPGIKQIVDLGAI